MALVLADRVQQTTTTSGTGTMTLSGSVFSYQSFSAIGDGNTTYYTIVDGANWEVGIGTYTASGTTLSRDTVLASSAGGTTKITLSGATANVFVTYPAERSVNLSSSALTSGRVPYATTSGLLTDAAGFTFSGTALTFPTPFTLGSTSVTTTGTQLNYLNAATGTTGTTSTNLVFSASPTLTGTLTAATISASATATATAFIPSGSSVPTNGVYLPAANSLGFSTNSTERMRLDSSGYLGINTSSPQKYLHVASLDVAVSGTQVLLEGRYAGYGAGISFQSRTSSGGTLVEMARITADGESAWNTTASTQDAGLRFFTTLDGTAAEKMRLDASGNLGVGTSSPAAKFDAFQASTGTYFLGGGGDNKARQLAIKSSTTTNSGDTHTFDAQSGTGILAFATTSTERMRLDASGNLGIGMTPSNILDISQTVNGVAAISLMNSSTGTSASSRIYLGNSSGSARGRIYHFGGSWTTTGVYRQDGTMLEGNGAGGLTLHSDAAPIYFAYAGSEKARIGTDGSFLVGTTGLGTIGTSSGATIYYSGEIASSAVGDSVFARRSTDGATITFRRDTTSVGSISVTTTATAYNTSSDARLKDNIADAADAGAIIDALRVRQWDWKSNGSHQAFGFIAQEEAAVYPDAVTIGDDGDEIERQWSRDDSKLVPLLVKEIQSLRQRLAALEAN